MDYHKEKLGIEVLSYNTFLLITKNRGKNFDITRLQTDNTLNIRLKVLINKEEAEIIEAKFRAKSQIMLKTCV